MPLRFSERASQHNRAETPMVARSPAPPAAHIQLGAAGVLLFLFRVNLDQAVQELAALEQRLDADVLVEAMNVAEVAADEHGFHAVRRNPDGVRELAIRGTRL